SFLKLNYMLRNLSSLILLTALVLPATLSAQRYFTRDAKVYFDATSKDSPERIEATAKSGTIVLDASSGKLEAAVLVKNFLFERALMQEHFNENYLESSKYPKAIFKGKFEDASKVDFSKDGTYNPTLSGELTLHGKTKQVKVPAKVQVKGGKATASASFTVTLSDFDISVPSVVSDKLAKEAKISIDAELEPMKK
ncbi:MAG: YceI family protein, partial [Saprospiraceae bacterium]|nr:YceI family protein [Saprospiraceae bacterium]